MTGIRTSYVRIRRTIGFWWGGKWNLRAKLIAHQEQSTAGLALNQNQKKMFFILGSGRSGTNLLTKLLSETENVAAYHEPNFWEDVATMDEFRRYPENCIRYWNQFRKVFVYRRWQAAGARYYGEVNGTIRYQAPAIKALFPLAKMFLISRDGRGVIRSVMGWPQFYGKSSKGAFALSPLPNDPFYDEWVAMSRFEKVCWSWRDSNEFLMSHINTKNWLRLEDLTSDYDYFKNKLCDELGFDISFRVWKENTSRKSANSTTKYNFPEWDEWSADQKKSFFRICGDTMESLGYKI